jgi:hypothetical protein
MSEATVLRYERIADRPSTFAAWIGHPNAASVPIGYVRLDGQIRRVARTLGADSQAADIRPVSCPLRGVGLAARGCGWPLFWPSEARGMRIKILRRSHATGVAPSHGVWRSVPRLPTGRRGTQRRSRADRCHVRIGIIPCGLIERGS